MLYGAINTMLATHMRKLFFVLIFTILSSSVIAAEPIATAKVTTLSVDQDLVSFVKFAIWAGGIFLAVFASIGIAFFGWDVRKARAAILDAQKETSKQLKELQADYEALKQLKENLEQLGAQLEESVETRSNDIATSKTNGRSNLDLIREVIATSNYKWTTIGRIVKRTGLKRDKIIEEVQSAPEIQIGYGLKTKDIIYKFKTNS